MFVKIKQNTSLLAAQYLEEHRKYLPPEVDRENAFYLVSSGILYFDETLDNEIIGELDKLMVRFVVPSASGDCHTVLGAWARARNAFRDREA